MTVQAHDSEEGMGATCFTSGNSVPVLEAQLVGAPREPRIALMVDKSSLGKTMNLEMVSAVRCAIEEDRFEWYVIYDEDTVTHGLMSPAEASLFLDFLLLCYGAAA